MENGNYNEPYMQIWKISEICSNTEFIMEVLL